MFSDTQRRWLVLLAFLPVVIDMTILHIAVPSLTQALGASATEVLWIIDIYPLLMPGLLVAMGTLADRIGNRRVLLTDRACHLRDGFPAGRLCADTSHAHQCTGLLALVGAMIMPGVFGTIRCTFQEENERAIALGLWAMVRAAGRFSDR